MVRELFMPGKELLSLSPDEVKEVHGQIKESADTLALVKAAELRITRKVLDLLASEQFISKDPCRMNVAKTIDLMLKVLE